MMRMRHTADQEEEFGSVELGAVSRSEKHELRQLFPDIKTHWIKCCYQHTIVWDVDHGKYRVGLDGDVRFRPTIREERVYWWFTYDTGWSTLKNMYVVGWRDQSRSEAYKFFKEALTRAFAAGVKEAIKSYG